MGTSCVMPGGWSGEMQPNKGGVKKEGAHRSASQDSEEHQWESRADFRAVSFFRGVSCRITRLATFRGSALPGSRGVQAAAMWSVGPEKKQRPPHSHSACSCLRRWSERVPCSPTIGACRGKNRLPIFPLLAGLTPTLTGQQSIRVC